MSRILIITNEIPYPQHRNGCVSTVFNCSKKFIEMGNDVSIIYLSEREADNERILLERYGIKTINMSIQQKEIIGKINKKRYLKPRNCWYLSYNKCPIIDAMEYEIVLFANLSSAIIIDKVKINRNTQVIFMESDLLSLYYRRASKLARSFIRKVYYYFQSYIVSSLEKKIYEKSDKIVFVSEVDTQFAEKEFGTGKFFTNKIAVETSFIKDDYMIKGDKPVNIGFSGIMDYEPNKLAVDFIISKVLPQLELRGINYIMHIIGKNPCEDWKHNKYVNEGKLIITGFVEDIDRYIGNMDLYISPLFLGTGMKNKILQAMAIGVPIICSEVSSEGIEGLEPNYNYVRCERNATEWSDAIVQLSNDMQMRVEYAARCKKIIDEKYKWGYFAKNILES